MVVHKKKRGKTISVTGREGPYGCETSRFQRFLDNWLTDGGEAASLTRRPAAFCPQATVQLEVKVKS
jgi:hypothetical protein